MADRPLDSQSNYDVITNENGVTLRRSVAHLPTFFRTDVNERFLSATLDQLIQPGKLVRLDGYVGRRNSYTRSITDKFIESGIEDRDSYQLEPTVTYTDKDTSSINPEDQVKFTATYDDYINQLKFFGGDASNHDRLNKEKIYSWDPAIDFDKLINYREYYWMPEGPNPILIASSGTNAVSEINVTHGAQSAYLFGTYPGSNNPSITLYRGNTYKFIFDTHGHPFYIMTEPFKTGVAEDGSTSVIYSTGVSGNGIEEGTLTFTVPTSAPDVLYYQCGNHQAMQGVFTIRTIGVATKIDVDHEIIGTKNYTLKSGTKLSNGMKVRFENNVANSAYANKEFYVEGVGASITLTDTANMIVTGPYTEESTEPYDAVPYADRPYSISFYRPVKPDYITIKRDSIDGNAWSRYNRWFHRAVIEATAAANGYTPVLLETDRAKRPIIEFDSGLSLFNHGTTAKRSVTLIDTVTTDVFSKMVNTTGYIVDGVPLVDGMRLLITADTDPLVNNRIYLVNFVKVQGSAVTTLRLSEGSDALPLDGDAVSVEMGAVNQAKTFYYSTSEKAWIEGQSKMDVNQPPLFALFDENHKAFNNDDAYPNSTFTGSRLFEYKISPTSTVDPVLGLQIKYYTVKNLSDIVFTSDFATASFQYNIDDKSYTKNFNTGHAHQILSRDRHVNRCGWIERTEESKQRVTRLFSVDKNELKLFPVDVFENSKSLSDLSVTVDVNHVTQNLGTDYTLVDGLTYKYVKFAKNLKVDDLIKLSCYSSAKKIAGKGIYEIPENIAVNPFNAQLKDFTYGQILNHLHDINEKNVEMIGKTPGSSNLRDIGNVRLQGGTIIQHGAALPQAMFLLIDQNANAIKSIEYCNSEYTKFKETFLANKSGSLHEGSIASRVDEIIKNISENKNVSFPFYYDDMIGHGENLSVRKYTVQDPEEIEYAIDSQFDTTTASKRAVYIYLNDQILLLGYDYNFSAETDGVTITATLAAGDIITIKDYASTVGSFVPPTPTKLGIYPKFKPEKIIDNTYRTSVNVIVGHDGSRTIAFGDYRDDLLLELEKRIYNNCKTSFNTDLLSEDDVRPGVFRTTEYNNSEIDKILSLDFYAWAGQNGIEYQNNLHYDENDFFTFNYSKNKNIKNGEKLPGYWRGIYKYFYDTDRPHTHPWEMLGHSERPSWWVGTYGPAPYTSGNELLWNDLAAGYDTGLKKTVEKYKRSGLSGYIPVDANGNLKSPVAIGLIDQYQNLGIKERWKFGDQGPSETAWRRSSQYPFSVMKLLALTKPAKFFGYFLDNSRLGKNVAGNYVNTKTQVAPTLASSTYYLDTTGGSTPSITAGYQPFIVNYLIKCGLDPAAFFYDKMKNLNVQLAYKLGGFTDKQNLKILTDSVSPGSTSGSQFIPDENYKVAFRVSNPVRDYDYSGVLVELNSNVTSDGSTLEGGYKIIGYNNIKPYFRILKPVENNNLHSISIGNSSAIIYNDYSENETVVPYGTVFNTTQQVINFLVGYGKYLESQGFVFDNFSNEIGEINNWETSAKEFLYWTRQSWAAGSAITLSPGAAGFVLKTSNSVISKFQNTLGQYSVLDSGGRAIGTQYISTKRIGNKFSISMKNTEEGIYNISMCAVQKEQILLFDNITVFSDIIFELVTGFRQQRLKLVGWKTADWNGDYYSPGFVFDEAKVDRWVANRDYQIGNTVEYLNGFYTAKQNHNSGLKFEFERWTKKKAKPSAQLIPNFDYKISQFNDFYNLETNNFDETQQKLAQHLTGYQSRPYLENLFLNDVSQYKFYQGFIREKGTLNAIDRLVKAKFYGEDININAYSEWMIKVGEFGNLDGSKSIQLILPDNNFTSNAQSIELLNDDNDAEDYARSLSIISDNFYSKPLEYSASNTFSKYDYSQQGYDRDFVQKYKTAGYVRITDAQHTAFNVSDILNLDVNRINNKDLIWIAKKSNNDWDVQRITYTGLNLITIKPVNNNTQVILGFNGVHKLTADQYIAINNSQFPNMNKVYQVRLIVDATSVLVDFANATTISGSFTVRDESTVATYGNLYRFISVRLASLDTVNEVLPYDEYKIADTVNEKPGDKIFVDNVGSQWKIYEKVDPYVIKRIASSDVADNQEFGYKTVARSDGKFIAISAPGDRGGTSQGFVNFFSRLDNQAGSVFTLINSRTMSDSTTGTGRLGESLSISTDENFIVAGAPYANILASDGSTRRNNSGLIKLFIWNPITKAYDEFTTITPADDGTENINFGWSHALAEPTADSDASVRQKYLLVGAPGYASDTGIVYLYTYTPVEDSTFAAWTQDNSVVSSQADTNKRFGHRMAINDNGDILAVSSVSPDDAGMVEIFVRNSPDSVDSTTLGFTHVQTFKGTSSQDSTLNTAFGESLSMSKDGRTLVISAPGKDNSSQADAGAVYVYKWNMDGSTNTYTLHQTIQSPETATNMRFGSTVHINHNADRLVIGAEKFANSRTQKFDSGSTTFDLQDTNIVDVNIGSGGVFTATKYNSNFILDGKLITDNVSANDDFGRAVWVIDNTVFVGAPGDDSKYSNDSTSVNDGMVAVFDLQKQGSYSWKVLQQEESLIDDRLIDSAFVFDRAAQKIKSYIDYFDPIKGRILGIADREINYKTEWDPAVYNIGTNSVTVKPDMSWAEEHVGEVWWDLSKARWIWYEQGNQEYRTKNWGKLFPGSTIDLYEWVESTLLPSAWSQQADSALGLSRKISGQPLYPDDTVLTVRQKYDSRLDGFINYYYYWVKNSVYLPDSAKSVVTRVNTTGYISNIITNPKGSGIRHFAVSDQNKLIAFNMKNDITTDNTVLNITYKDTVEEGDAHYVWKLIKEGDKDDAPNAQIERKWWDSLIGSDESGNEVPDISLSINQRYGNKIRPRQSWYVDRFDALKEIIDYTNSILAKNQMANNIRYKNLNSSEPEPTAISGEWDSTVDTYDDLTYIDTRDISGTTNVLVKNDQKFSKGFWAIYNWNGAEWIRTKLQTFKTSAYYSVIDWYDVSFDANAAIEKQLNFQYELDGLTLGNGKYVKILTADTGGWKIFESTSDGFKNIATQNGTIELKTSLYDYTIDNRGFDGEDAFDINFFDTEPKIELRKILTALRDDLLIGDLKIEYNNIFFIGLRKVLEQQKYVDWLSKTSFINVSNILRELDQRKSYRVNTENYVEEYINEVKPYHTKIREYRLGYTGLDIEDGIYSDFDLPAFYDGDEIRNVDIVNDIAVLSTYPYRFWRDNYKKYVDSITVMYGGSGYLTPPTVTLVGGTTKTVGPFTVLGTSTQGASSGQFGYFYPLYTAQVDANIADSQAGGNGTSHLLKFSEFSSIDFYMPNTGQNVAKVDRPAGYEVYTLSDVTQATARAVISGGAVSRIVVLTNGKNYTSTPRVIITGGGLNGNTPLDSARAYANLRNDLVRDISTTIKFDRVQSTATILPWASNKTYAFNDLIRYDNKLYKVITTYTSTEDFDEGLSKLLALRGDEPYITAAERTLGLYAPTAGMPGNELSQLMTGVDYGGVMVTGLAFDDGQGWDRSPWYNLPWDGFGLSRVKVFYGDGTTINFSFDFAPLPTDVYTVYFTDISDSSAQYPVAMSNVNRVRQRTQVLRGDGTTKTFTILGDDGNPAPANTVIELIPFDDDGVLTPTDDKTLDSLISGGLFKSALGVSPTDILVEGDAFITPETSYAPEENLPGSIFDSVDIRVYTAPTSGVPFIIVKNYIGDGSVTVFPIGQLAGTQASVVVSLDGATQTLNSEYTVDTQNKTVTFAAAPSAGSKISIKSFAISGSNYMVLDTFVGDGSTHSFITKSRETYQLDSSLSQLFVTVDGVPTTDYSYTVSGRNITVHLHTGDGSTANPPAAGTSVQIASFNQPPGSGRAYAEIRSQEIVYDGSTSDYTLSYPPGSIGPFSSLTLLEHNGKVLRGPDNTYYLGDGSSNTFSFAGYAGSTQDDSTSGYVDVKFGEQTGILNTPISIDSWPVHPAAEYNGVWYLAVTREEVSGELATAKYSLVHNNTQAFVSMSSITKTGIAEHITVDAIIDNTSSPHILSIQGTGSSVLNSVSWYRIGLGANTVGTSGTQVVTLVLPYLDSVTVPLESPGWDKNIYRGAKYFITVESIGISPVERSNMEVLMVHDGTNAYATVYNVVRTTATDMVTVSVDINAGQARLLLASNLYECSVKAYRILLGEADVNDGTNFRGTTSISSNQTTIDTFQTSDYIGAHYLVTAYNASEGSASMSEVTLIVGGSSVFTNTAPHLSTKSSDQVSFTGSITGNVTSLVASATSGSGTIVSVYRFGLLRNPAQAEIDPTKVRVYLNGIKQDQFTDYVVNIDTASVTFNVAPASSDLIAISTVVGTHYHDSNDQIILQPDNMAVDGIAISQGDIITATTFNNAVGMNQRRETFKGNSAGEFYLFGTPLNNDYVFVWLNGENLIQGFDWTLAGNEITISRTLQDNDRIDVMYFVTEGNNFSTGFRIFKDMLNRTFYKRISQTNTTKLAAALLLNDKTITVVNGSVLKSTDGSTLLPGVIFIGHERIEYLYKDGNVLSNIRRGTLGTSIKNHSVGAEVVDASGQQTVPYADTIYTKKHIADGSTTAFISSQPVSSVNEVDIFVGGTRLPAVGEDGSTANYTVNAWDGSSANVILSEQPAAGTEVKIIQKRGQTWYNRGESTAADGKGLGKSNTAQAKFIAGEPTNAPE